MPKEYTSADFNLPKVCGLAIHNAKNKMAGAINEYEKALETSLTPTIFEVETYCLYGVYADASVLALAGQKTSAGFAPMVKRSNLNALTDKYKFIGYVTCRKVSDKKQEWKTLNA